MTTDAGVAIREAVPGDAPHIAVIYNEGIKGRNATFETSERTSEEVLAWFDSYALGVAHPFLVATDASGEVEGWVRASLYRSRECYAGVAEVSAYVAEASRGKGIGSALMSGFIGACEGAGIWKLVSRVFPENVASRAMCARHGFREVGTYEKHGRMDGVWRDVVIVERIIPANIR